MAIQKTYPWILMIGSVIGLLASFLLMLNTMELATNPDAVLPCNLNPFVSCTNSINAWQGRVFGFPNPLLGIISFSMLFAVGVMLFSGGRSKKPLWLLVNLGTLASLIFVIWFYYQSLYRIGTLCAYCMIVWVVTLPIFLYTTVWNYKEKHFDIDQNKRRTLWVFKPHHQKIIDKIFGFVSKNHAPILIVAYAIMILLIIARFRDFFLY